MMTLMKWQKCVLFYSWCDAERNVVVVVVGEIVIARKNGDVSSSPFARVCVVCGPKNII